MSLSSASTTSITADHDFAGSYKVTVRTRGEGRLTNYWGPAVRKGAQGPTILLMIFFLFFSPVSLSVDLYKLTLSDLTQVTVQPTVSPSDLV